MDGGNQPDDDRIRPSFVALLVLLLAGVTALIAIPLQNHHDSVDTTPPPIAAGKPANMILPSDGYMELSDEAAPTAASTRVSPPSSSRQVSTVVPPLAPPGPIEKKWGVRVSGVWLAPESKAVVMTYQVTDSNLANLLSANSSGNYLTDSSSGTQIPLCPSQLKDWPFSPHSRARSMALQMLEAGTFPPPPNRLVDGKTYTVLIPNPNELMKSGSKVAVVVGGVRSDVITVE